MPSAERSVSINRPAAEVFAFVAEGANAPEWRSRVVEVKRESGDGIGTVYRQRVRGPMRRRVAADYEITLYEVNKKLEFKQIAGSVRPTGGYRFHEANGKTKVTFWLKGELRGWKRFVLGRSVQKSMDAEMKALDRLKEVLESGAPARSTELAKSGASGRAAASDKAAAPAKSAASRASGAVSETKSALSAASTTPKASAGKATAPAQTRAGKAAANAAAAKGATPRTARRRPKAQ